MISLKAAKALANRHPAAFEIWKRAEGVNRGVALSSGQWLKFMKANEGLDSNPRSRPEPINLSVPCPATGYVRTSCSCNKCVSAKISNRKRARALRNKKGTVTV